MNPTTHIQNTAPGPPNSTAIATPAMLPSPTVPDSAVDSAWKCVSAPLPWRVSMPRPATSATPCVSERYCEKPLQSVNSTPVPSSVASTGTDSITALMRSSSAKKSGIGCGGNQPGASASVLCAREYRK